MGNDGAAVDVPVAVAMLEGDAPLPTGFASGYQGVGGRCRGRLAVYDKSPIAGQPAAPVFVARFQCLFNEQPAEAGAVDEEVGGNRRTGVEFYRLDESVARVE